MSAKIPSILAPIASPKEIPKSVKALAPIDMRFVGLHHDSEGVWYSKTEILKKLSEAEKIKFNKSFGSVEEKIYPLAYIRFIHDLDYEQFARPLDSQS